MLSSGDKLGPYEILSPIGKGGMGEVYRAHDSRLKRDVAIKVSTAQFSERFEREAQAIAALNHSNICQLYDIGPNYLVMEYIEGTPLVSKDRPLPLDLALKYAVQICDALDAAHKKGITHRDLKPQNILATKGGIKLLDFGLARLATAIPQTAKPPAEATLTMALTGKNEIVGTIYYMSPEQLQAQSTGQEIDGRSDIFSFGLVLYEMLTGKRAFDGSSPASVIAAIMERPAPSIANVAPPALDWVLKRCLEKDPENRWQTARDLKAELERIASAPGNAAAAPSQPRLGRAGIVAWAAAGAFAVAAGALTFVHLREKAPVKEMTRFEISAPAGATFGNSAPQVSPDGRKIAFIATGSDRKRMVWVRSLDAEEARPLPGTEDADNTLIWSPDSRSLAFVSGGKLKRIEASGGPAQTLCDAPTSSTGVWTPDNKILFGGLGPLQLVSAAGGTPTPLTVLDKSRNELGHLSAAMLPDGRHFLYSRLSIPSENGGVYIGSLDAKPDQQSAQKLLPDTTPAVYVPSLGAQTTQGEAPGFLLFLRGITLTSIDGTLMAQPFDPGRMEFKGEAVPIADRVSLAFSASPTGVLAFRAGTQGNSQLTWVDRNGAILSTVGEPGDYQDLALSPDGARVAFGRGADLWLFEFARGVPTKFTFGNLSLGPWWSADGSRIVFVSIRGSGYGIYQKASNLAGQEELLFQSTDPKARPSGTHDGKFLIYSALSSDGKGGDLWVLPLAAPPTGGPAADRKPIPFLRTEFNEGIGAFSPDGRWVAYQSNQSGKYEIYVLPFDESNPGSPPGSLHQVSKDGGGRTLWRADGKELFYGAPDGYLMSVDVNTTGGTFQTGAPQRLFKLSAGAAWVVAPDGKRFLLASPVSGNAGGPASLPIHVVVNWTALLKR